MAFGEDFAETGPVQQKQHFTSYERDAQTGTDYAVNRAYSFAIGRFQSADPFQQSGDASAPQSWNRYTYVMNAPVDFADPSGLLMAPPRPPDSCGSGYGPPEDSGGSFPVRSCVVTVSGRPVKSLPGKVGYDHLFITLWDNFTNVTTYAAGRGVGGTVGHQGGTLEARFGLFDQRTADDDLKQ